MRRRGDTGSSASCDPSTGRRTGPLDSLTGMRFLAALLIVLHHTVANRISGTSLVAIPDLRPIATVSYTGVSFFFVLSGFVLAWSWSTGSTRVFFARRFARIYPLHVVTWAAWLVLLWQLGRQASPATAVLCLLLVQAWSPNAATAFGVNAVSWSLSCEAFFYGLFPGLAAIFGRLGRRALVLTIAGAVVSLAAVPLIVYVGFGSRAGGRYLHYLPSYRLGEFVVGMCLALLVGGGFRFRAPTALTTVAAAAWLCGVAVLNGHARGIFPGSSASGLPQVATGLLVLPMVCAWILSAASADLDGRPTLLRSRVLRRLGVWSYALYLTHTFVLRGLELAIGKDRPADLLGRCALELAGVGLTVAASGLVYEWIERPLERTLRRRMGAERTVGSPDAANVPPETPAVAPRALL